MTNTISAKYDVEQIKKIQKIELSLLEAFKRICDKYGFDYYAIGGTCIGAIRHKGFIPWDDDIDIAMPMKHYMKFIEIAEKELEYPYGLVSPLRVKHSLSLFLKIEDASTTFIEDAISKYEDRFSGVTIDIFPISGLPKNKTKRDNLIRKIELLKKINYKLRFPIDEQLGILSKVLWLLFFPFRVTLPFYWATYMQYKLLSKYEFDDSQQILFPWRRIPGDNSGTYKNIFYYDDFKKTLELPFEDTTIRIPIGYHRYLSMDFGNYMKLPDEDKQIPIHANALIDLEKPYSHYKRS